MVGADLIVLPLWPHNRKTELTKVVQPVSFVPAREPVRRIQGQPAGSKNRPKLPIIIARDSADALKAHAMEVSSCYDVKDKLTNFARKS